MLFDNLSLFPVSDFTQLPGLMEPAVSFGEDLFSLPQKLIFRGDVPYGAMETLGVVVADKITHNPSGVFKGKRGFRPDTLLFQALVPPFNLPVALWIVGGCPYMVHPAYPYELLEILCNKLWAVIRYDPGLIIRESLPGPLQDDFDVSFCHGFADLPMDNIPAIPIQDTTQVIESTPDIQVRDIYMPMFMGSFRILKPIPFLRRPGIPSS